MSGVVREWNEKRVWSLADAPFWVEVVHWTHESGIDRKQINCWNVYAYITDKHPRFLRFKKNDFYQQAAEELPFHGGCTYCQRQMRDGLSLYKVGSDYRHFGDERFEQVKERETAAGREIFADALTLFNFLLAEQNQPESSNAPALS
jgi:hypothetical protein